MRLTSSLSLMLLKFVDLISVKREALVFTSNPVRIRQA